MDGRRGTTWNLVMGALDNRKILTMEGLSVWWRFLRLVPLTSLPGSKTDITIVGSFHGIERWAFFPLGIRLENLTQRTLVEC